MKKAFLVFAVVLIGVQLSAQKTKTAAQNTNSTTDVAPPPPPPPPPLPPPPPPPPPPKAPEAVKFTPPVIVSDKGYDISIRYNNGNNMVYMKKKGATDKVSLEKWLANNSFYENKYGKLPPPPPPAAPKAPKAPPAPPAPPVKN